MRLQRAALALAVATAGLGTVTGSASAASGSTERVSLTYRGAQAEHKANSSAPSISADGRFLAFESGANNLVPGDDNGVDDVFVRNLRTGAVERVSISTSGNEFKAKSWDADISADGQFVAFTSRARLANDDNNADLDVYVHDRDSGKTSRVSVPRDTTGVRGDSRSPSISATGARVAFASEAGNLVPGDTNKSSDVFVRELGSPETTDDDMTISVSVTPDENQGNAQSKEPAISADGRYVAFESDATNMTGTTQQNNFSDVFLRDVQAGTTELVSKGARADATTGNSYRPSISADGTMVAFHSAATDLVAGDTNRVQDVFVRDLTATGTTTRISVNADGRQGNRRSYNVVISGQGGYVGFLSEAANLVARDTNAMVDVFLAKRNTGRIERVSVTTNGAQAQEGIPGGTISVNETGQYVAFDSKAPNLVVGDTNLAMDVFVRDRLADLTPPRTRITRGPANKSFVLSTRARIGFGSSERGSTYRCRLDGRRKPCDGSSIRLTSLSPRTHKFKVNAADAAGNRDRSAAVRTWTVPRNNTSLRHHKGWVKRRSAGYYMRTYSKTRRKGAVLTSRVRNVKRLALVATKAPRNGKVEVYLGKRRLKRVGLSAPVTRHRRVLPIATFKRRQSGRVKVVVVTARRTVRIEGLGVATR